MRGKIVVTASLPLALRVAMKPGKGRRLDKSGPGAAGKRKASVRAKWGTRSCTASGISGTRGASRNPPKRQERDFIGLSESGRTAGSRSRSHQSLLPSARLAPGERASYSPRVPVFDEIGHLPGTSRPESGHQRNLSTAGAPTDTATRVPSPAHDALTRHQCKPPLRTMRKA